MNDNSDSTEETENKDSDRHGLEDVINENTEKETTSQATESKACPACCLELGKGAVLKAWNVITHPDSCWSGLKEEDETVLSLYKKYFFLLTAIGPVCVFLGGQIFGYGLEFFHAIGLMLAAYVMALVMPLLIGKIAQFAAGKFGGSADFVSAFKLIAFAMSASYLAGVLSLQPMLAILGAVASIYSIYLFYKGAAVMVGVPEEKSLVYTAVVVVAGVIATIILGSIVAMSACGAVVTAGSV